MAFGFGEPDTASSNIPIASKALAFTAVTSGLIITDRDVSPNLRRFGHTQIVELDPQLFPNTLKLATLAVRTTRTQGFTKLYVVAMPCHMWRCLRDLRWAAQDAGIDVEVVPRPVSRSFFDRTATTWVTRSFFHWWPAEIGYRVASILFPDWYKRTRA